MARNNGMAFIEFSDITEINRVYLPSFDEMNPCENDVELWAVCVLDENDNVERVERYADERDYFSATHNVYGRVILDEQDIAETVTVHTYGGLYDFVATIHYADAIDTDED